MNLQLILIGGGVVAALIVALLMWRFRTLRFVAALLMGVAAIVVLLNLAATNLQSLQAKDSLRRVADEQATVFPATATALAASRATPTPTPVARRVGDSNMRFGEGPIQYAVLLPTNTKRATSTPPPAATTPPPSENGQITPAPTSTLPRVITRELCTDKPQPTAVPTRAPRLRADGNDIMNILLMGSDADLVPTDPAFRTDTMVIVSINRTLGTVAMLSIARDLYVCIPQLGMQRINVAYQWGESVGWQPGGGFGLLQETILYNLGIPVHYYARVSFTGFRKIIDTLNGVNIAVDCPMVNELRFTGQYNEQQTPQYAPFTLPIGYYRMDGSLALWYARVRSKTSDFDRNRRQQQLLRAIWREARDQGLLARAPELWNEATQAVATNLTLTDVIGLLPFALNLTPDALTGYQMVKGRETQHFRTPAGEDVQIPDPEGFFYTLKQFYTPPTRNKLSAELGTIQIVNGSGNADWDKVAADALGWLGYNAVAGGPTDPTAKTMIYDYTGGASPAALRGIAEGLNLRPDRIVSQPDPNRTVDFQVVLGADYNSCTAPGFGR